MQNKMNVLRKERLSRKRLLQSIKSEGKVVITVEPIEDMDKLLRYSEMLNVIRRKPIEKTIGSGV